MVRYWEVERLRDLRELVERGADRYGDRLAYIDLDASGGEHAYTFNQVRQDVAALGTALIERGLAGKHIAIVAESCYTFPICYLSVVNSGGVIVPLDRELSHDDLVKLLHKGDVEAVFHGDCLLDEIPAILEQCPQLQATFTISRYADNPPGPTFDTLLAEGRTLLAAGDTRFAQTVIDPEALAVIMFTSGTTGANKGVMLNHRYLAAVIWSQASMSPPWKPGARSLSVLPIHHIFEFNLHTLLVLEAGFTLCYNDSILHLRQNLVRFKPDMIPMVPMIAEGLYKAIMRETEKNNLTKALKFGLAYAALLRKVGLDLRRVFFKPVLEHFGGNLKTIACGGAPLRPEIEKFYDRLGIDVLSGYGLTECVPATNNGELGYVAGSVGIPVRGVQIRIRDVGPDGDGEIQLKGDNVMLGYYRDPAATAQVFTDDGWLRTGDLGHIGRRGALFLTGRIKNLIILDNGKNVSPEELEEVFCNNLPYVKELLVSEAPDTGQGPRIALTVYFEPEWLLEVGPEKARARLDDDVLRVNRTLTSYKRVQVVDVRDNEFEKTPTRKIKRLYTEKAVAK